MSNGHPNGHATYPHINGAATPQQTPRNEHAGQSNGHSNGHNIPPEQRTPPTPLKRVGDRSRPPRRRTKARCPHCMRIMAVGALREVGGRNQPNGPTRARARWMPGHVAGDQRVIASPYCNGQWIPEGDCW